jgi:hypothetical protein
MNESEAALARDDLIAGLRKNWMWTAMAMPLRQINR